MLAALLTIAFGAPCTEAPPLEARVEEAWRLYNDAEVEAAKDVLAEAYTELVCPQRVVTSAELLDLYRADGLVSISLSDNKGAVYATLRAVAADHDDGAPPEAYGPYLAELYETWASRAGAELIEVAVDGGGTVYVDGRPVAYGVPIATTAGEHLVQLESGGTYRNEVLDLTSNHVVVTGLPLPPGAVVPASPPEPVAVAPVPQPAPDPVAPPPETVPEAPPDSASSGRRRPAWAFAAAALAAGGGGFAIGSAAVSERNLKGDTYAGLGAERAEVIRKDQQAIRVAYGVGYGLSAVSAGLLTVGIVGVKVSAQPTGLRVGGRF